MCFKRWVLAQCVAGSTNDEFTLQNLLLALSLCILSSYQPGALGWGHEFQTLGSQSFVKNTFPQQILFHMISCVRMVKLVSLETFDLLPAVCLSTLWKKRDLIVIKGYGYYFYSKDNLRWIIAQCFFVFIVPKLSWPLQQWHGSPLPPLESLSFPSVFPPTLPLLLMVPYNMDNPSTFVTIQVFPELWSCHLAAYGTFPPYGIGNVTCHRQTPGSVGWASESC